MPTTLAQDATVLGACPHDCPDTCSMLVKVQDGKVTGVQGNPAHPFTQGRLCAKTSHYQERVYHRDRVLYPMRRVGAKGPGKFERTSWDEALAVIAEKWKAIIACEGPTAILPYSYLGTQGIVNGLTVGDPFFNRLGATVSERTFCDSGASTAYIMTLGPTPGMDPESLRHSRFILLWACNLLSTNAHLWPFIDEAKKHGAKLVVIDPVKTGTSAMADQHIRPRPGTDGALALAMIHVIIGEGLVDQDYVARYTVGYEELVAHVAQYTPEFAAAETGIAAEVIRTLAREYAAAQPAAIRIGVAIERSAGGGQLVRALACLPALVGAWRKPGGGLLQLPLWAFPVRWDRLHRADLITPGTRVVNQWQLGRALTGDLQLDPPIGALFVYNSNSLVVAPDQLRLQEGLAREDLFTVVSEQFMTDTARYADLVLPATTQVEQDDIMFSWGHLYLTLNRQAIAAQGEAVPNSELFRRLARVMEIADPFFFRSDDQIMREAMDWTSPAMQGISMELLEQQGWARLNLPASDVYAPHAEGHFPTPSGKVELKASMAAGGNFVLPTFRQGSNEHQDGRPVPALPTYQPPRESGIAAVGVAASYPLAMMSPKNHAFLNSSYGNLRRQAPARASRRSSSTPSTPECAASATTTWCASTRSAAPSPQWPRLATRRCPAWSSRRWATGSPARGRRPHRPRSTPPRWPISAAPRPSPTTGSKWDSPDMTHVVSDHCLGCRYTECVRVCPVDCFHGSDERLYIDPDVCIDRAACVPICPVKAISDSFDIEAGAEALIELNRRRSRELPIIDEKSEPLPTAVERRQALGL